MSCSQVKNRTDGLPSSSQEQEKPVYNWVDFQVKDPDDPFEWSPLKKWIQFSFACVFTIGTAIAAASYVSGLEQVNRDFGVTKQALGVLPIAVYPLGCALPPLFLAPFSEFIGRKPIYVSGILIWVSMFVGIGFSKNIASVIIFRLIQGGAASIGASMVGGTAADLWRTSERGIPMALFAVAGAGGAGAGPLWAGWVAQTIGWRWIQHIQAAFFGAFFILFFLFVSESRGSVILARRAARLRKETGDESYRARAEEERESLSAMIKTSLTRPMWLLVTEPIVFFFSLWLAFAWGMLYNLLESIGLVFLTLLIGTILGFCTTFIQEALYRRNVLRKGPEARLYAACAGGLLAALRSFKNQPADSSSASDGWTSFRTVSIAGPIVGLLVLTLGIYHIYLAVFNYLADSYLIYASSALAAQSFLRNMFGFAFPLFATQMYTKLTYPWASTLIGLLGAILGIIPFALYRWGPQIRAKSQFSHQLQLQEAERIKALQAQLGEETA
ncbi:hypothetical protein OC845_003516 [Tilletia horrida]|nr:hypothetical protein OC845_003516 [Tilletia horrida]